MVRVEKPGGARASGAEGARKTLRQKGPVFDETPESEGRTEEAIRPGGESFRLGYGGTVFGMGPDAVPPFFENGDWNMRRKRSEHNGTKNPTL